ncbi:Modification methylase DpnIIA [Acaryochloris thomasi RCC1774]|uniref:Site-specific DNA-methyltransferase (adenine-specific) n=1 Tax=Acaryochloris thomasi RCC1774 TaxID=1764569 RepID=A0A2W1JM56_9CYAN|nr:DNA adenine methylase [Acaryochloris thomasi]PZD72545.1 Modification methylase DpnIIA [Acaryochloris thomasi RCC1774]
MTVDCPSRIPPRPFLKWAGGKSRLLAQYQPWFPQDYSRYYEPFVGGGAVFFHLRPASATLSDINPELVNVYDCVRSQVEALIQQLEIHAQHHGHEYYYQMRAADQGSSIERAARFIYLNKTCFNGLYRENSQGKFNVPMGRYKKPTICNPELLRSASMTLQAAQVYLRPFSEILQHATTSQDFVYFDPPYHPLSTTSDFTAYSRGAFTAQDQVQLRDVFVILAERGVRVMLSNSDCDFIRDLYQGFPIRTIQAARAINSNPAKRGKISEVLVMSS